MLGIVPSCNLVQYQEKLMMQPQENDKNHNFKPNFGPPKFFSMVLPLLVVRQCSKLSPYAIFRKTNKPNLIKMTNLILGPILTHLVHIWSSKPFLQILPLLVRDCSNCSNLKKKLMNQTWENGKNNLTLDLILAFLALKGWGEQ